MNPFIAKEIRLLQPGLVVALLLAVAPMLGMLAVFGDVNRNVCGYALCGGLLVLALSSFGREFELRTFSQLLAQPVTRRRIFLTKCAVLVVAMVAVYAANFLSWLLGHWWIFRLISLGRMPEVSLQEDFGYGGPGATGWISFVGGMPTVLAFLLVAFTGGLWTTLLLRQIAASFWFAVLIPASILYEIIDYESADSSFIACLVMVLYSAAGLWWAWHQFQRAQEVGWTGGTITLPDSKLIRNRPPSTIRARQPVTALLRKEAQLYQVAIMAMGGLFLLHIGAVVLRGHLHRNQGNPLLFAVLELFAGLWFTVPLLAGGLGVADERQLGTLDSQFCLPVSKRVQFVIKMAFALFITGVMAAVLPWLAEAIGDSIGSGGGLGGLKVSFPGEGLLALLGMFTAAAAVAFYASTLARNLLQAIGVALATAFVLALVEAMWLTFPGFLANDGLPAWGDSLIAVLGWPAVTVTLVWLGYGNFRGRTGAGNLWFHNLCRLAMVVIGISVVAIAITNRAWELLSPIEPPHGQARLAVGAPRLQSSLSHVSVLLADGRLWEDSGFFDPDGKWQAADAGHFLDGTNWIAEQKSFLEDAAIRADGTLWVSEKPVGPHGRSGANGNHFARADARMIQFGRDTNWLSVARFFQGRSMILLKTDGTLWRWGNPDWEKGKAKSSPWPGLTSFPPVQLGTATNWAALLPTGWGACVWDQDGKAWRITNPSDRFKKRQTRLDSETALERSVASDHIKWKSLSDSALVGVHADGTLWGGMWARAGQEDASTSTFQIGTAADWVSAEIGRDGLVALKADGSLWEWRLPPGFVFDSGFIPAAWSVLAQPPKRLGIKQDWVAISGWWGAVAALAADGSLWYWWPDASAWRDENTPYPEPLLAPSRRPVKVANIFGEK